MHVHVVSVCVHPVHQVKVWNTDKRDSGSPLCTRIFPAIPGNKPTEVSCLSVHENLNFMAIGTVFLSPIFSFRNITDHVGVCFTGVRHGRVIWDV